MKNSIASCIVLEGLEIPIHLGWPDAERLIKQMVIIDIKINFSAPPLACQTDDLNDTFCYDSLVTVLKKDLLTRQFRLLEHVGAEIYSFLKKKIQNAQIAIRINKKPPIENLTLGVSFCYSDGEHPWSF